MRCLLFRNFRCGFSAATCVVCLFCVGVPVYAAVFVDADFNGEPLGPVGTQLPTDPFPRTLPTRLVLDGRATANVVDGAGDLRDKPLLLTNNPGELASVAFYNPVQITSGTVHITWDSLVTAVPPQGTGSPATGAQVVENRGGILDTVLSIYYRNAGSPKEPKPVLTIEDAKGQRDIADIRVNRQDHFDLVLNLETKTYRLVVARKAEVQGELMGNGNFLHFYFRCMARGSTQAAAPLAFDNLMVEVLPAGMCRPVEFEDLPMGSTVPWGTALVSNGVLLSLRDFYWGPGGCVNPTNSGNISVDGQLAACGSGQEIWINNVNVHFDYGTTLSRIELSYGEFGGNVNLIVNGSCANRANFADMPASLGGVNVTVKPPPNPGQGCGTLALEGIIYSFAIGGQELAIDNVFCESYDMTPPVAEITSPHGFECACSPVEIIGSAYDPDGTPIQYTLAYTRDVTTGWTTFATGNTPVVDGVLGVWNATGVPQGFYLVRLVVTNASGLIAQASTNLYLDTGYPRFEVRSPADGAVLGRTVCVDGNTWDHCFKEYTVQYSPDGSSWSPVEPGTPVYTSWVYNDPIAHWDTVGMGVPDGSYLLRTTARDLCDHVVTDIREVIVDNTPPTSLITAPEPCGCVEGLVTITGTANDANLRSWVLQYTGGDAAGWVTIASGTTPIVNGVLGVWDTSGLRPCAYSIRLRVVDEAILDCNSAIKHVSEYMVSLTVGQCDLFCSDPICLNAGDLNGDGTVDLSDPIYLLRYLFGGGPPPVPSEPICP